MVGIELGGLLKGVQRLARLVFSMPGHAELVVHPVVFRRGGGGVNKTDVRPFGLIPVQPGAADGDPGKGRVVGVVGEGLGGPDNARDGVEQFRRQPVEPRGLGFGVEQQRPVQQAFLRSLGLVRLEILRSLFPKLVGGRACRFVWHEPVSADVRLAKRGFTAATGPRR